MIPSPSRIPPYPWRSDHCTAPCTRRSSAGRGTHAARHCQFVGPQGPPSRHQIPPSSAPAAMAIPLLGVERIGTAQGKTDVKLIRSATPLGGSLTLLDVAGKTDTLVVSCSRCDRAGRYPLASLIERHGRSFPIPALLRELSIGADDTGLATSLTSPDSIVKRRPYPSPRNEKTVAWRNVLWVQVPIDVIINLWRGSVRFGRDRQRHGRSAPVGKKGETCRSCRADAIS